MGGAGGGSPVRIWPSAPALKPHSERFIEEIRTDRSASKRQVDEQGWRKAQEERSRNAEI